MKLFKYIIIVSLGLFFIQGEFFAQERITERGTSTFRKVGVHRGNRVRTVFSNWGVIATKVPGAHGNLMQTVMSVMFLPWLEFGFQYVIISMHHQTLWMVSRIQLFL